MQSTKQSIFFHERPVTELRFHKDGDVFFAASKDCAVSMINTDGKVLGSFDEHKGAISAISCFENSLVSAATDLQFVLWDVVTGRQHFTAPSESVVRGIDFGEQIYFCTDSSMNKDVFVGMLDPRTGKPQRLEALPSPATRVFHTGEHLVIATANGEIYKFDLRNRKIVQESRIHQSKVTDMKPSTCRGFFITSSSDSSAKIIDTATFAMKKQFDSEEPINSVAVFGTNDVAVCVGGINARDVTTTRGKGSFDTIFFDIVTQQRIGHYATHFGTINAVDVHPQGTSYVTGGEDSSICLVRLGEDFKKAPFTRFE